MKALKKHLLDAIPPSSFLHRSPHIFLVGMTPIQLKFYCYYEDNFPSFLIGYHYYKKNNTMCRYFI